MSSAKNRQRIATLPTQGLAMCLECQMPCPEGRTVCAVCAPERIVTLLARCAAALCFAANGPRLDERTALLSYGAKPADADYITLRDRGWIVWSNGWRLTERGTQIYIALHENGGAK